MKKNSKSGRRKIFCNTHNSQVLARINIAYESIKNTIKKLAMT